MATKKSVIYSFARQRHDQNPIKRAVSVILWNMSLERLKCVSSMCLIAVVVVHMRCLLLYDAAVCYRNAIAWRGYLDMLSSLMGFHSGDEGM